MVVGSNELKSYFKTGSVPTQENFENFVDSAYFYPVILKEGDTVPEDLYDYDKDDFKFEPDKYGRVYPFIKILFNNRIFDLYYQQIAYNRGWVILDGYNDVNGIPEPSIRKVFVNNGIIKLSNNLTSYL